MAAGVVVLALAGGGCVAHLPAPPTPEKVVPQLSERPEPPGDGEGQVIVDATNGPASVTVIVSALNIGTAYGTASSVLTKTICATTPCAVNLPVGAQELIFAGKKDDTMASSDTVQVGRTPTVFRHTVGSIKTSPGLEYGGLTLAVVGGTTALTGLILLPLESSKSSGFIITGVGGAVTAIGAAMMYYGRTVIQPGSSVQWTPDGSVPTPSDKNGRHVVFTGNGVAGTF
jgi:hypothetical protein